MKLLEKKKINESVQAEQKIAIDSGIFLATKVDKLRNDLLNLEKQRADFIAGSKETLENVVRDLKYERDNLTADIKESTKQLTKLRQPLDTEWNNLEQMKDEVIALKVDSEAYFQSIIKERGDLHKEKAWVDSLEKSASENQERTFELLQKAERERNESKKLLSNAETLKETKEVELYLKEVSLNEKEQNLSNREELLKKDRLSLNKEKKLLAIKKQRIQ